VRLGPLAIGVLFVAACGDGGDGVPFDAGLPDGSPGDSGPDDAGAEDDAGPEDAGPSPPRAPSSAPLLALERAKTLVFRLLPVEDATFYRLFEAGSGDGPFEQVAGDLPPDEAIRL